MDNKVESKFKRWFFLIDKKQKAMLSEIKKCAFFYFTNESTSDENKRAFTFHSIGCFYENENTCIKNNFIFNS